jgi:hypothetical protein
MKERTRRRRLPLTVGIAARCDEGAIFVAADRMVTVGDMEMEHPVAKVLIVTQSILICPSDDDAAFHFEILLDVHAEIKQRVATDPQKWITVREVVDLYIETRQTHKLRRAERDILKPLGLDLLSYQFQQQNMDSELVRQIAVDLINYKIPNLSAVIAGIDPSGCHIYVVDTNSNNHVDTGNYGSIGYAAIGAGARHASAHFLTSGHAWYTPLPEALWNTYLAKKRAEVAPGVGETTDLYMIGPSLGADVTYLNQMVHGQLKAAYEKTKDQEEKARKAAAGEITAYVKELAQAAEQPKAQIVPPPERATAKDDAAGPAGGVSGEKP